MNDEKKKTGGSKVSIILIAIIAALVFVVIGLAIALVGKNNKNEATTTETIATKSDATTENITTEQVTTEHETITLDFIRITAVNSWETDGRYYSQFDVQITNSSEAAFKNWKLDVKVPNDTLLSDIWNGNGVVKDGILSIEAQDYNQEIAAGTDLSNVGFIISTKDREGLSLVGNENAFYSDGKLVDGLVVTIETTPTEEATEEKTTEEVVSNTPPKKEEGTPYANHGKLSLKGTDIVDENGDKYQLKGLSTHGIAWFPEYVNKDAFQTFRDDWDANLIRLAMYTDENNGYCSGGNRDQIKKTVCDGVEAATELGMYVIVDWHVLHDLSPKVYEEDAKVFFADMSKKYKDYDNVIYEICNEPNGGTTWADVKEYAEDIIPIIRENAPDALIIVGTPTWSQDVDIAAKDPITGYDNIMYAVHFYAATHTDNIRNKVTTALNAGLPIFVSEFSICDASGNGAIDYGQAEKWFDLINANNLSYAAWNISNKNETSSVIKSSCTKTSGWTVDDLSDTGVWIRKQILGN